MKNIMKSQIYQLVRNRSLRALVLATIGLSVFTGAIGKIEGGKDMNASDYIVGTLSIVIAMAQFITAIITGIVCADDFNDKTSNYELTSGRLRSQSYAARAIISVILSCIVSVLMIVLMIVTSLMLYPHGSSLNDSALVQRVLLMIPIFIRLSCFFVLISYIVKKPIAVFGVCYAIMMLLGVVSSSEGSIKSAMLTGFGSFKNVCHFDEWYTYGLNTPEYHVYEPYIDSKTAALTVLVSLAAGALYLLLGYSYFHRDDIE
ncbi:MAG: hypothetical protein K6B74_05820 [Ruminococcus sp.]|nr:hypothetical protein [Ruminococcus sp.]